MHIAALLITVSLTASQAQDTLDRAGISDRKGVTSSGGAPAYRADSEFLEKSGAVSLQEALRTFSGISVRDYGGIGGLKTVSIRNFGSQYTGICYDGIMLSNVQNGQVDIGRFNLDNVESVTVEIAGGEDIFRSARLAACAGVLSINSRHPEFTGAGTSVSARMRVGSFGTYNPYLSIKQRLNSSWSADLQADYLHSEGNYPFLLKNGESSSIETRTNSDVGSLNSEMNIYGDMGKAGSIACKLVCSAGERGLPGSVVFYTQNPAERLWDNSLRANVRYSASLRGWRFRADLGYDGEWNRYRNPDPLYATVVEDTYFQQEFSACAIAMRSFGSRFSVSLAEDLLFHTLDSNLPAFPYPLRLDSYTALSFRYRTARLVATGQITGTYIHEWVGEGSPSPDRFRLAPAASLSYRILRQSDLKIRASYKESYRVPTFNDVYYPRVGNRELSPEKAYQSNLGLAWSQDYAKHGVSLSCDGYCNYIKDKIVAVPSMFIWSMRNIGAALMTGLDVSVTYSGPLAGPVGMRLSLGYSYQYAVDVSQKGAKNYLDRIAYVPANTGNASLVLETPWVNIAYTLNAVGERYSLSQNLPAYRIDPYADHCVSINGSYVFGKRHRWIFHFNAEMLNVSGCNYEVIKYYPMPGRNYRLTIKFTI